MSLLAGFAAAVVLLLGLGYYYFGFHVPRQKRLVEIAQRVEIGRSATAASATDFSAGRLVVTSSPSGAEVIMGGQVVGRTPLTLPEVIPGAGAVELRLKGYKPQTVTGTIMARQELRLNASLEKLPYPQPGQGWENTLGQKFVPVPGTGVLFCIWETREQDYAAFARATGREWSNANAGGSHPAVNVSWLDAQAFCEWLTQKERREETLGPDQSYRLPLDAEWSLAVGLTNEGGGNLYDKNAKVKGQYPWGTQWSPPRNAGNYHSSHNVDSFEGTAPVGSFAANQHGLHDLGGNVWEWCGDLTGTMTRGMRGASLKECDPDLLLSSRRVYNFIEKEIYLCGFRVVVAVGSSSR